jgi:hypothetical protein
MIDIQWKNYRELVETYSPDLIPTLDLAEKILESVSKVMEKHKLTLPKLQSNPVEDEETQELIQLEWKINGHYFSFDIYQTGKVYYFYAEISGTGFRKNYWDFNENPEIPSEVEEILMILGKLNVG